MTGSNDAVAIIPARGGSKRLPRKNIVELGGRPIIGHTIEVALRSGLFDKVLVSTDDYEIANIAASFGAEIQQRPSHLADDYSGVVDVCLDSLQQLLNQQNLPEYFCCIYATAAFLNIGDLIASREVIYSHPQPDVVIGVSEFELHPYKALISQDGYLRPLWPEKATLKSQEYPKMVASNGTFCWARTAPFLDRPAFYTEKMTGFIIPRDRAIDLDTEEDLRSARILWQLKSVGQGLT